MTYEVGKEYRTRDGQKARVYATDGRGMFPIHGAIWCGNHWMAAVWTEAGFRGPGNYKDGLDLIPAVSDAVQKAFDDAYERDGLEIRDALAAAIAADRAERAIPDPDDEAIEAACAAWAEVGKFSPDPLAVAIRAAFASMRERAK